MVKLPQVPDTLETERLTIRSPRVEDAAAVYASVRESLEELAPWMPWATPDYSLAGCEENTRDAVACFVTRSDLRYHVFDRVTGEHVANSGLHAVHWEVPKFEIGYWCRKGKTGKGYVTETVRALTRLAFEGFGAVRVEIRCDDRNARSYRVAERCGYRLEGVLKNDARALDGSLRDTRVYALTDDREFR